MRLAFSCVRAARLVVIAHGPYIYIYIYTIKVVSAAPIGEPDPKEGDAWNCLPELVAMAIERELAKYTRQKHRLTKDYNAAAKEIEDSCGDQRWREGGIQIGSLGNGRKLQLFVARVATKATPKWFQTMCIYIYIYLDFPAVAH